MGYAGHGPGKNNPAMQQVHKIGPIPRGLYQMQQPADHPICGKYAMGLAPHLDNQMFGRSGMYEHGENSDHPGESSDGCIILGRLIRQRQWESGDHDLKVVATVGQL